MTRVYGFGIKNPHTKTRPELERGLQAARADWIRNLTADFRTALGDWILEVESILEKERGLLDSSLSMQ
jgi:hypothetical protein